MIYCKFFHDDDQDVLLLWLMNVDDDVVLQHPFELKDKQIDQWMRRRTY